jgi:hypothetical protein
VRDKCHRRLVLLRSESQGCNDLDCSKRGQLEVAQGATRSLDATNGNLDDPAMLYWIAIIAIQRDGAGGRRNAGTMAGVEADANCSKGA